CKESQLTNKMGLLNDNLVVTYPWGGIKINGKKKEDVHYFAINNSISSLYCLEHNCIIILGSYDGTLTIIDTTQKNTDPNYTTKNFINEDYEAKTVIHPRTVAKGHIDTQ